MRKETLDLLCKSPTLGKWELLTGQFLCPLCKWIYSIIIIIIFVEQEFLLMNELGIWLHKRETLHSPVSCESDLWLSGH